MVEPEGKEVGGKKMSEEAIRIFPKSSAFEMLLGKVQLDLWEAQTNPALYYRLVKHFVDVDLPTMFQNKVKEKIDFDVEFNKLEESIKRLREVQQKTDALNAAEIENNDIPAEYSLFATKVWHATVDVLTAVGLELHAEKALKTRSTRS